MTTPTLSQLGEMTDEELRVRLAELRGYKRVMVEERNEIGKPFMFAYWQTPDGNHIRQHQLPNYPKDANAVAEVRKGLSSDQFKSFLLHLGEILDIENPLGPKGARRIDVFQDCMNSSERQQTIALILALTP